jgi:hypothetical protein
MCLPSRHAIDVQGVAGAVVSNRMPHMARRARKKMAFSQQSAQAFLKNAE